MASLIFVKQLKNNQNEYQRLIILTISSHHLMDSFYAGQSQARHRISREFLLSSDVGCVFS